MSSRRNKIPPPNIETWPGSYPYPRQPNQWLWLWLIIILIVSIGWILLMERHQVCESNIVSAMFGSQTIERPIKSQRDANVYALTHSVDKLSNLTDQHLAYLPPAFTPTITDFVEDDWME